MKKEFRAKAKKIRGNILKSQEKSQCILENLITMPDFQLADVVFSYMNIQSEVSTEQINQHILNKKKTLALPKVYGKSMKFHRVSNLEEDTRVGSFKVLEPKEHLQVLDEFKVILVPAVAFSTEGYRLGYGAGFYDKYLEGKKGIFIGICFDEQIFDEIPRDEFDVKMDFLVTPSKIIDCRSTNGPSKHN